MPAKKKTVKPVILKTMNAEQLFEMSFSQAASVITQLTTQQKVIISSEINSRLDFLYNFVQRYGEKGVSRDEEVREVHFIGAVGRIKRWETLLYWLFEMDLQVNASIIAQMIADAEAETGSEENNTKEKTSDGSMQEALLSLAICQEHSREIYEETLKVVQLLKQKESQITEGE